jgi:hypothetical protein
LTGELFLRFKEPPMSLSHSIANEVFISHSLAFLTQASFLLLAKLLFAVGVTELNLLDFVVNDILLEP